MHMGPTFFLGVIGLQAISWVLLIAGVSAVQAHCNSRGYIKYATFGYFGPGSCSRMFGMAWWAVWYQFLMILGVMAAFMTGLARWRLLVLTLMAPLISLMMQTANSYLFIAADNSTENLAQPRVVCAGSVLLCITNFLLVYFVATYDDREVPGPSPVVHYRTTATERGEL